MRNAPKSDFLDALRAENQRLDPWERQERENAESKARQQATREAKADAERQDEILQSLTDQFGAEAAGVIFDISTNRYKPTPDPNNQQGIATDSNERSVDEYEAPNRTPSMVPNGTVGVCINGSAYYIDVVYDDNLGPYSVVTGPNYEISEP